MIIGVSDGVSTDTVFVAIIGVLLALILLIAAVIRKLVISEPIDDLNRPISDGAMRYLMQRVSRERSEDPNRQS